MPLDLTGLYTSQTEAAVKEQLGSRTRVACIGPAGENLVRFASISNDGGRQAGQDWPRRPSWGSKNLKAIAVRGSQPSAGWPTPSGLTSHATTLLGEASARLRKSTAPWGQSPTSRSSIAWATLPALNFRQSTFEGAESVGGEALHQSHHVKNAHCANCTIGCEQILETNDRRAPHRRPYGVRERLRARDLWWGCPTPIRHNPGNAVLRRIWNRYDQRGRNHRLGNGVLRKRHP